MNTKLIAPCGMDCILCSAYHRDKNNCPGCNFQNEEEYCKKCSIKKCEIIKENNWKFCSPKCEKFPCKRLKQLDKRYTEKYEMSMIENLNYISKNGIRKFIENEKKRWVKNCKVYCVHKKCYYNLN